MKRIYVILLFSFFISEACFAQVKKKASTKAVRPVANPFEMVHVDDTVRTKLSHFIARAENDSTQVNAGVKIQHLLMKDRANNFQFVEGIYWFRLMNTHPNLYYFIYTKKHGVHIIRNYSVENLLNEFARYFDEEKSKLSEQEKIDYINALSVDLKSRLKNLKPGFYGDYEVREKAKNGTAIPQGHL